MTARAHLPLDAAAPRRALPLVVELAGPAGAGKTVLLRALGRTPRVRAGVHIDRLRHFAQLVLNAAALVPVALALPRRHLRRPWYSMLHFLRLRTLPRTVARAAATGDADVILLDEGPVFSLGRLSVFQQASQGEGRVARTWQAELERWSGVLDAVVWIDAPDAVLAERIRKRPKHHQIKHRSDAEVADFLASYRRAYREIARCFAAQGRVAMIHVDTTGLAVDAAAARVRAELERLGMPRGN